MLDIASADLAREAVPLPRWAAWAYESRGVDARNGVLLIGDRERSESRNAERWEGDVLYWTLDQGFIVVRRAEETYRCWSQGESDPSYDILTGGHAVGIRDAVRKYGADGLASAILRALARAADRHEEAATAATEQAQRFAVALSALGGVK